MWSDFSRRAMGYNWSIAPNLIKKTSRHLLIIMQLGVSFQYWVSRDIFFTIFYMSLNVFNVELLTCKLKPIPLFFYAWDTCKLGNGRRNMLPITDLTIDASRRVIAPGPQPTSSTVSILSKVANFRSSVLKRCCE